MNIELFFTAAPNRDAYVLMYYDVLLHKEIEPPNLSVNGINILAFDEKMKEIDWAVFLDPKGRIQWDLEDELNLKRAQKIEVIVDELTSLDSTQEGKFFAAGLKLEYWAGMPDRNLADMTSPINKQIRVYTTV